MHVPNAINGATLKANFPPNPMSKSSLVIGTQERKGFTENQGHSHKSKQKQKETNGIKHCFHIEIVITNCEQVAFDFHYNYKQLPDTWELAATSLRVFHSMREGAARYPRFPSL